MNKVFEKKLKKTESLLNEYKSEWTENLNTH